MSIPEETPWNQDSIEIMILKWSLGQSLVSKILFLKLNKILVKVTIREALEPNPIPIGTTSSKSNQNSKSYINPSNPIPLTKSLKTNPISS